jgi:hypothetical protein
MALEDDIRRTLDRTAAQLRDSVSRQVAALGNELTVATRAALADLALTAQRAAASSKPSAQPVTVDRLLDGSRALTRARSLTDGLDALVAASSREALRVAVLLVRGQSLAGWRFVGFDTPFDEPQTVTVALDDAGLIADAIRTRSATVARDRAPAFAGLPAGHDAMAAPIAIADEIVAVLYADQAGSDDYPAGWTEVIEWLTADAARTLEALTAVKAVQFAAGRTRRPSGADTEDDDDAAARRYARLLVSEIKLYHEPQVVAGRRGRDLRSRLGGEIARARSLYEQRVPAPLRERTDYFEAELVRTLADGDASLLGQ